MSIILRNGRIVDGSGNPWYHADIAIENGKIVKIRSKINGSADRELDVNNLIVSPGFIDVHSHTDFILPFYSKMDSFIQQGITTCAVGMCGQSLAPIHPEKLDDFRRMMGNSIPIFNEIDIKWNTFKEYITEMEKLRIPANLIFFVGFENIRIAGGPGFNRQEPTKNELETMKNYVIEAMEAGAFGMSTGLIYAPQVFAKTEEIIELAKVVAKYNGFYFSHIRGEGATLIEAVKEFIEIMEKSKCIGGQIAHHKVAGIKFWGKSIETLKLIEDANERGLNINCDSYPYNRAMTGLSTTLPPWAREGNDRKVLMRLSDPGIREKIKTECMKHSEEWENIIYESGFESLFLSVVNTEKWKPFRGKNIAEITKIKDKTDDWETYFEILIDEKLGVMVTIKDMGEEDILRILASRYQMVGTDGAAIPVNPRLGSYHPRFFGTYPRILGKYVREKKILTLENAIRKMTSFPAQRLGLRDRGLIREGLWADIVVFNPDTIIDKSTFIEPHQVPEGINYVIVNGVVVVDNKKQYRKYPGKVIKRHT